MFAALTWLAASTSATGPEFGLKAESQPGSDAFVLMTLGLLAFLFLCFALWGWRLWRREQCPAPHVRLLMELEEDDPSPRATTPHEETTAHPWERRADWWQG